MWEDRLVGQQKVLQSLRHSLVEDTLSHAVLFTGPFGYGSLPLALTLAQDMLCLSPSEGRACGKCKACIQSEQLIHPDFHMAFPVVGMGKEARKNITSDNFIQSWRKAVIDNPYLTLDDWIGEIASKSAVSDINVTECDNIFQRLKLMSYSSTRRIQFIWRAEQLGLNGNKLLKLIEEPTPGTFIFLFAENKEEVINTIISRCREIRLAPIDTADMTSYLQANDHLSTQDAHNVSFLSEGDYNQAKEFIQVGDEQLIEDVAAFIQASMSRDYVLMRTWSDKFHKMTLFHKRAVLMYFLRLLRELLHMKAIGEQHVRLNERDKRMIKSIAPFAGLKSSQIDSLQQCVSETYDLIHRNVHSRMLMFNTCLKIDGITHLRETFKPAY